MADPGSASVSAPEHGQLVSEGHHLELEEAAAAKAAGKPQKKG